MSINSVASREKSSTESSSSTEEMEEEELDKDELERYNVSLARVLKMNNPEWPHMVVGSISSILVGASFPIFAVIFGEIFGVSTINAFYIKYVISIKKYSGKIQNV